MAFSLGPAATAAGFRLRVFDSIDSTNAEALRLARAGDPGGIWLVGIEQTAGRGRRGRAWTAPKGNLSASLMIRPGVSPDQAATLGFVAGLALTDALARFFPVSASADASGMPARLRLKWPNDVLLGGAKLTGMLLEAEREGAGGLAVAIGIGVNVVAAPDGLPYRAASLHGEGVRATAEDVFAALAEAWVPLEALWRQPRGLEALMSAWTARAAGLGEPITVRMGETTIEGTFRAIDAGGRLVLGMADGSERLILAGDIYFGANASSRP